MLGGVDEWFAWGRRVDPADVQVVLLAVDAPADAHLAQVEVELSVHARPKVRALMLAKLRLAALAAPLELVAAIAEPSALILILGALSRLLSPRFIRRHNILLQYVRVDRAYQDLI